MAGETFAKRRLESENLNFSGKIGTSQHLQRLRFLASCSVSGGTLNSVAAWLEYSMYPSFFEICRTLEWIVFDSRDLSYCRVHVSFGDILMRLLIILESV